MKKFLIISICLAIIFCFSGCILNTETDEVNLKSSQEESNAEILEALYSESIKYSSSNEEYEFDVYDTYVKLTHFTSSGTDIVIPSTIENLPVKILGEELFNKAYMSSVTIPDTVVIIGSEAFAECRCLDSVTIPDSVIFIGSWAFRDCSSIYSVSLPEGITNICEGCFARCYSLTNINIPENVVGIGSSAFDECSSLQSISISDNVTEISDMVFRSCTSLAYVSMSKNIKVIGDSAFKYCPLTEIDLPSGMVRIGHDAFWATGIYRDYKNWENGNYFYLGEYLLDVQDVYALDISEIGHESIIYDGVIREGTTLIADWAFYEVNNMASVTMPNSIEYIGQNAFANCEALTNVDLSDNLKEIAEGAFSGCKQIQSIVIPDSVTKIDYIAFLNCNNLESITMSDNIEYVGERAFESTAYMKNDSNWENNALYIDNILVKVNSAAEGSFNIKNGTKIIVTGAFEETRFTEVNIPSSVSYIGADFYSSYNLSKINVDANNTTYYSENGILFDYEKTKLIASPIALEFSDYQIPDTVKTIESKAFYKSKHLCSIIIGSNVVKIGTEAFSECASLSYVSIGGNVEDMGSSIFKSSSELDEVFIEEGVKKIPYGTFMYCKDLKKVTIPKSVTYVSYEAFFIDYEKLINTSEVTIYTYEGTAAYKHAISRNIPVEIIE